MQFHYQRNRFLGSALFIAGFVLFIWLLVPYIMTISLFILSFYLMYKGLSLQGTGLSSLIMMHMMGRGRF